MEPFETQYGNYKIEITGDIKTGFLWVAYYPNDQKFIESEKGSECDSIAGALDDAQQQIDLFEDVLN